MSTLNWMINHVSNALKDVDISPLTYAINKATTIYGSRIFIIGNGGSSAIASHFAQDLVKACFVNATCLTDNQSAITALANDNGFKNVFVKQLEVMSKDVNDIVIAFSCSGTSPNIIEVETWCVRSGRPLIVVHGDNDYDYFYDSNIKVNSFNFGVLESAFDLICHTVISELKVK